MQRMMCDSRNVQPQSRGFFLVSVALLLVSGLGGCGGALARSPVAAQQNAAAISILVFNDGFHSGFLVPFCDRIAELDPVKPALGTWLELGFAAESWMIAQDNSLLGIVNLSLHSSAGVIWCTYLNTASRPPRDDKDPVRVWSFRLSQNAWQAFQTAVVKRINPQLSRPRQPDELMFIRFSTERWRIFSNCHDFVADVLRETGIPLAGRMYYTASRFTNQLDAAYAKMIADGISTIDAPSTVGDSHLE